MILSPKRRRKRSSDHNLVTSLREVKLKKGFRQRDTSRPSETHWEGSKATNTLTSLSFLPNIMTSLSSSDLLFELPTGQSQNNNNNNKNPQAESIQMSRWKRIEFLSPTVQKISSYQLSPCTPVTEAALQCPQVTTTY